MNINQKSAAFTGHRLSKLPLALQKEKRHLLINALSSAVNELYNDGYTVFYSGMCTGVDLWGARCVLEFKNTHPDVKLVCAIPFEGHSAALNGEEKALYDSIVKNADSVVVLRGRLPYSERARAFNQRNCYMVKNSDALIAVFDRSKNEKSGTANTVKMAYEKGIRIIFIDPESLASIT